MYLSSVEPPIMNGFSVPIPNRSLWIPAKNDWTKPTVSESKTIGQPKGKIGYRKWICRSIFVLTKSIFESHFVCPKLNLMIPLSFLSQIWRKPGVMRKNGQDWSSKHGYLCSGSFEQDSILMLTKSIFELNFVSPKPNLMTPLSFLSQVWRKPGVMRKNGQDRSSERRYLCSGSLGQNGVPTQGGGVCTWDGGWNHLFKQSPANEISVHRNR